jgi:hypothetical protein
VHANTKTHARIHTHSDGTEERKKKKKVATDKQQAKSTGVVYNIKMVLHMT